MSNTKQCINELYDPHDPGHFVQQAVFSHVLSSAFLNINFSRKALCQCLGSTLFVWEDTVVQIPLKIKAENALE